MELTLEQKVWLPSSGTKKPSTCRPRQHCQTTIKETQDVNRITSEEAKCDKSEIVSDAIKQFTYND